MLEAAGDLGLEDKPTATDGVVRVCVDDLLERHLAVQLGVESHEDRPQAAAGVGPQNPEPLAFGGHGADGVARGVVGIAHGTVYVVVGRT